MTDSPQVTGEHKAMLAAEFLHAAVVLLVVVAATLVYFINPTKIPQDLLGFVYGGAITYSGGRAGQIRGMVQRSTDFRNGES